MTSVYKDNDGELEDINEKLQGVEESFFNISIYYTSPFEENFTFDKATSNIIHGFFYSTVVYSLTLIGAGINWSWDYLSTESLSKILIFLTWILILWIISKLFLPIAASYIFVGELFEEKWNIKLKWYYKILIVTLFWFISLGLIGLIFVLL